MADDLDDRRDDELARALAVEPLDELTRRRLVTRALDQAMAAPAPTTRGVRTRLVATAAAVAFLVLGFAALALPGSDTAEVAGRSPQQKQAAPGAAASPSPADAPLDDRAASADRAQEADGVTSASALVDLGDLGDLAAQGSRARVLAAARRVVDGVEPTSATFTSASCTARELEDLVATGTGDVDGRDALVLVTRSPAGSLQARALLTGLCEVRPLR